MKNKILSLVVVITLVFTFVITAAAADDVRVIRYFTSKAPTDDVVVTIQEIADKYIAEGGNIQLEIETAADRAAYDQKLRTMVAGDLMPDIFEIDATPYCQELADAGLMVDMEAFLTQIGALDSYIPLSLNYQRLPDGRVYMIPLEFTTEMVWFNVDIFNEYGLSAPKTFDEWLEVCAVLKDNGVTPIAIDGIDGWAMLRYIAQVPFRKAANDYLTALSTGDAKMSDPIGLETSQFVADIGQYFQVGFSSTDYTTARNLFLNGKAAMYEIGTWELNIFTAENLPEGLTVDYFYMPMSEDAVTSANEYWAFGGIGLACTQASFDPEVQAFITYLVNNYDALYLSKQHFPPRKIADDVDLSGFDPLFLRIQNDMTQIGNVACKPWDTVLPADVVSTLSDNIVALAMGMMTPEEFVQIIDDSLAENIQ